MTAPREFRRYRRVRLKKESRTIRYPGVGKGHPGEGGMLYKCWNCGFICDEKRDPTDRVKMNISYTVVPDVAGNDGVIRGMIGGPDEYQVFHLLKSDGSPRTVVHTYEPTGGGGCPNCHIPNWRGDY